MELERAFNAFVGAGEVVVTSSCTSAMQLALFSLGLGSDDEVLVPTLTFAATADVVVRAGARPVFVDCDPETLNVTGTTLEAAWGPRVRAIMPVHFTGYPCDLAPIYELADTKRATVLEDAAHALPARYGGARIGGTGRLCAFSFYATKGMTTGEGGALAIPPSGDSAALAARLRVARIHGLTRDAWAAHGRTSPPYYEIVEPGFKANMSDVSAAIGLVQLGRCEQMHARRVVIAERYSEAFRAAPWVTMRPDISGADSAHHLFVVQLVLDRLTIDRDRFVYELRSRGIGASMHYKPLHLHAPYRAGQYGRITPCPAATGAFPRLVSLPMHSRLTDDEVTRVIAACHDVGERFAR
jgi:perosamine synthetase